MKKIIIGAIALVLAFQACVDQNVKTAATSSPVVDTTRLMQTGMEVSMSTFGVLSARLRSALEEGGVKQAVPYCQVNALPIADSLSQEYGVVIRRVTDRPRNPADTLNATEARVFERYASMKDAGESLSPTVEVLEDGAYFFAPILLQEFCQQCHGKVGEHIAEADYALIRDLYPADLATGYMPGELRGMWSIWYPSASVPYVSEERPLEE